MKYTKYILFFLLIGCAEKSTKSDVKENNSLSEKIFNNSDSKGDRIITKSLCLDTTLLKKMDVKFFKLNTTRDRWKWKLVSENEGISKELTNVRFFYSTEVVSGECKEKIDVFKLDSAHLITFENKQTVKFGFSVVTSTKHLSKGIIKTLDLNFDGIKDLKIHLNAVSGATNEISRYFIYNPKTDRFSDGFFISNLRIDSVENKLYNYSNAGHAGKIGVKIWSDIVNYDSLRIIKSIETDFVDSLDSYIQTTKMLKGEKYITTIDTIKIER